MAFDRPSNALFLPPEFSSLNCYVCVGRFEYGSTVMTINGSSDTPTVVAGSEETISVTGTTRCYGDVYHGDEWTEDGQAIHYIDFGDGYSNYYDSLLYSINRTVYYAHATPGLYTVADWVSCGCYYGTMQWDWLQVQRNVQVNCAYPTNFRQTSVIGPGGLLHFEYAWDSSTGNLQDLSACTVGEIVTYPNGNPYVAPNPPFNAAYSNPTVIDAPATSGSLADDHNVPGFTTPYSDSSHTGTQYYRYRCPCVNSGQYVNLMGPLSIRRQVSQNANGSWKYTITKATGGFATIDPLP
jgi:hypothetical protein